MFPHRTAACLSASPLNILIYSQDCQEFFKLLLNKLESVFARVPDKLVHNAVQSLFRGTYSYVTVCRCM